MAVDRTVEKSPRVKVKFDRSTLKTQLLGLHMLVAAVTKVPACAITPVQADALGESLADICEHYGLTASKEIMLWVSLGATCAGIYGPKVVPVVMRQITAPKKPKASVTPIRPSATAQAQATANELQVDPMTGVPIPDGGTMNFG